MQFVRKENLLSLACQHQFCRSCWEQHCSVLVKDGVGVGESAVELTKKAGMKYLSLTLPFQVLKSIAYLLLSLIDVIVRTVAFQTRPSKQWQSFPQS